MPQNNDFQDWVSIFNQAISSSGIPGTCSRVISSHQTIIRDLYVSLSDLQNQLSQAHVSPAVVIIYADVIRLNQNINWTLDKSGLMLVARRIEAEDGAKITLNCKDNTIANFVVYAGEISGIVNASFITSQGTPAVISVDKMETSGFIISCYAGNPSKQNLTSLQDPMLNIDSDLQLSMVSNFQTAAVLSDAHPDISIAMLDWIKKCSAQSVVFSGLFLQSSSLQYMLQANYGMSNFVPGLNRSIYVDSVKTYCAAALDYENQYNRFMDKNETIEARKTAANIMLENYQDVSNYTDQLIAQCKGNLDSAKNAVYNAAANMHAQRNQVELAQVAFKDGIAKWKYDQTLKAVVEIIGGIIEFAGAAAAMCVGDEAAAPAAGAAAAEVAKTSAETAKVMKKIAEIMEAISKMYESGKKIVEAIDSIKDYQELTDQINSVDVSATGEDDLSASDYWAKFKLEADSNIEIAIKNEIPGADEFKLQLDILALFGQSLASSQVSYIQTSQEYVRLNLQKQVSESQKKRLSDYINNLTFGEEPNTIMMQMIFQRYQEVKNSLFIALENYNWSYRYWALKNSRFKPGITMKVTELNNNLINIQEDYVSALQGFNPPPQSFSDKCVTITDQGTLDALKNNFSVIWSIDLDDPAFDGFSRVRVSTIRVWLDGVKNKKPVYMLIENNGCYQDRLKGKLYQFTASPLIRGFQYQTNPLKVLLDGKVADEQRYAYFEPTPFSTWKISLPKGSNTGIDLSGITQIRMEFFGSTVAE